MRRPPYLFRLQRRLFLSFGLTILVTAAVVAGLMHLFTDGSWRDEVVRVQSLAGGEFAQVWDNPAARAALAERISSRLDLGLELRDARGGLLQQAGAPCEAATFSALVLKDGQLLGEVRACAARFRPARWSTAVPLLVVALALWWTAGRLSRRILRPLSLVVRLAEDLGAGKLDARAEMTCYRFGEERLVAESLNRMADRIERQVADQRELLAAVSHEMRTPLSHLRILTETARAGGLNEKALDELDKEIAEMDALVGDLLANSRLQLSSLSLQDLDAADLGRRALERAGLDERLLAVEGAVALKGDATLLARALANLLENARRHAQGVTRLSVRGEGELVRFAVEDAGPGFAPEVLASAFDAFRHGTYSPTGTIGLGLNLVRRISQAHGGDAAIENLSPRGARVCFTVRVSARP